MTAALHPQTKMTVNLLPQAVDALNEAAEIEGNSRTDTVNRALQVYAELLRQQRDGWEIRLVKPAPGLIGRFLGTHHAQVMRVGLAED